MELVHISYHTEEVDVIIRNSISIFREPCANLFQQCSFYLSFSGCDAMWNPVLSNIFVGGNLVQVHELFLVPSTHKGDFEEGEFAAFGCYDFDTG